MTYLAWNTLPALSEWAQAIDRHARPLYLLAVLPDDTLPQWPLSAHPSDTEIRLQQALQSNSGCIQFSAANVLAHVLPDVHIWLMPSEKAPLIHQHFASVSDGLVWQTDAPPQMPEQTKPWLLPPQYARPKHVAVIGAGIAGAATARLLAEQGVAVTVLEAGEVAAAGSGNRQGLLYAKISPNDTEQTELLLAGYGYTRRLLQRLLPEGGCWGGDGVLHLNFDDAERKRNQALAQQNRHAHLYRGVDAQQASAVAGIPLDSDGLYWPQGVWLNPPAIVNALLQHDLIDVRPHTPLLHAEHDGTQWHAHTPDALIRADALVYCTGADSPRSAEANLSALPLRQIRGQTGVAAASAYSRRLRCALSGESYISPSWQNRHCYGASFVLNSSDTAWHAEEEAANRNALSRLHPELAASLADGFSDGLTPQGHAALRCDSPDHLPVVGALGDIAAMGEVYAKLALDKNYRLDAPCPYLPQAYANIAHGTRGLATAPVCAAALVAEMLHLPNPLSARIRHALHPNRLVIRKIVRRQALFM